MSNILNITYLIKIYLKQITQHIIWYLIIKFYLNQISIISNKIFFYKITHFLKEYRFYFMKIIKNKKKEYKLNKKNY